MHKLTLTTLLLTLFTCASLLSFSQNLQLKRSVAITDFKDISTNPAAAQGADPNQAAQGQDPNAQGQQQQQQAQGQGTGQDNNTVLMTMLTTELVKTNVFNVSEGIQPGDAPQFMVTGTITKWESAKGTQTAYGTMKTKNASTVSIDLRILDATTNAILSAQTVTASITQKNFFGNKADHTLDSCEHKVVMQCVDYIKAAALKVAWEGSIIKANPDGTVFMKPGSSGGVTTGMVFDVYRPGEVLKDDAGNVLGNDEKKIGSITVTGDIGNGKAARANTTSGKGLKSGDILKPQQQM